MFDASCMTHESPRGTRRSRNGVKGPMSRCFSQVSINSSPSPRLRDKIDGVDGVQMLVRARMLLEPVAPDLVPLPV